LLPRLSKVRAKRTSIAFGLLLLAGCGGEPEPHSSGAVEPARRPAIYGGEPTAACGWPSTVHLGGCTGTLIHPELVVLAAHCVGLEPSEALFGDDFREPRISAGVSSCKAHPEASELGNDIGFCRLAHAVAGVPIVPVLAGCEVSALEPGVEVVAVGFGEADDALGLGPKRQVKMPIVSLDQSDALIGGSGKDTCTGDSGGPVFVQLPDDTWRVFGVTSAGGACGQGGHYSLLHPKLAWLERESGLDLTPCHDGGAWAPSARCGRFPTRPQAGGGAWADGCASADLSTWSQTCGPPHDPTAPDTSGDDLRASGGCVIARDRAPLPWPMLASLLALWRLRSRAARPRLCAVLRLLTIPISHYCEKARWALDRGFILRLYEQRDQRALTSTLR
jgi:hypothetical protein